MHIHLPTHPSIRPSIRPPARTPALPSICPSIHPSIRYFGAPAECQASQSPEESKEPVATSALTSRSQFRKNCRNRGDFQRGRRHGTEGSVPVLETRNRHLCWERRAEGVRQKGGLAGRPDGKGCWPEAGWQTGVASSHRQVLRSRAGVGFYSPHNLAR